MRGALSERNLEALLRVANKAEKAAVRAMEKAREAKLALVERIMARVTE